MAEAVAAVSLVASIAQLVDFSVKIVSRLNQFHNDAEDVPRSLRHIKTELPVLSAGLQHVQNAVEANSVADGTTNALMPMIDECCAQMKQLDTLLTRMLPTLNDGWRTKSKKAIVSLHQDDKIKSVAEDLRKYITSLTFYCTAASSTIEPLTDTKLAKIRSWLSAPNPSTNYQKALKQRQPDTGLWLLESDQYAKWKTKAASFLWLHGIPGCGKTILSSTILQNVLRCCDGDPGKAFAYFFFDFNDVRKQNPDLMLRSLISQLSQHLVQIPASFDKLFSSCENGQCQPSVDALMEVARHMIQEFPQVYLILDALDECSERTELTDILETIAKWKLQNLHFLMTSRKEREIEVSLETFIDQPDFICLQSKVVDEDIRKYIRQRLSADRSLNKWLKDATIGHEIESTLMEGAHGMFRWAVCQLDTLGKCRNRAMLRKSLATLPPTLDKTYDRILSAISEEDSQYALRILRWLTFSARPLYVDEVAEVVAIDVKRKPMFDREEVLVDPMEALSICSSLITTTTRALDYSWDADRWWRSGSTTKVFALAHSSVKEYLLSDKIRKGPVAQYGMQDVVCHDIIATGCLGYLLQFQGEALLSEDTARGFKLARYAAQCWMHRAQSTQEETAGFQQAAMDLLSDQNDAYLNWLRIGDPDDPFREPSFDKALDSFAAPLYYASRLDLRTVVQQLLNQGADVNAQGGAYGSALQAAAERGNKQIVRLLLNQGADVNVQGGDYGNALQAASRKGNEQIVKLLLDHGADTNAQGGHYGSALNAASKKGHHVKVKLLLEKGADTTATDRKGWTPLHRAARRDLTTAKVLHEFKADIHARNTFNGRTALHEAAGSGRPEIVEWLLSLNADPSVADYKGWTPFHIAATTELAIAKMLYEAKADVNACSSTGRTALHEAVDNDRREIVDWLLSLEVNPSGADKNGWTALHIAAAKHLAIAKVLHKANADIFARSKTGCSVLFVAAANDQIEIVDWLISLDTQLAITDRFALSAASAGGLSRIVEKLLSIKTNVNTFDRCYGSPLQTACFGGHTEIVKLLLQHGAEVNTRGGRYGFPLLAAALAGRTEILRLLIERHDGRADLVDEQGRNALHLAARKGHVETFDFLVSKLSYESLDGKGDTMLHYAASGGSLPIVRSLLEDHKTIWATKSLWSPLHWAYRAAKQDIIELLNDEFSSEETVETLEPAGLWTPLSLGVFHCNESLDLLFQTASSEQRALQDPQLLKLVDDFGLKLVATGTGIAESIYVKAKRHKGITCDGCFHAIYGPRFKCLTCEDFDFCFMCKPSANTIHPGHEWKTLKWQNGRSVEVEVTNDLESDK